jgi:hypothetical protein
MDRRTFSKSLAAGALASGMPGAHGEEAGASAAPAAKDSALAAKPEFLAQIPARAVAWPSQTFRRLLVDTHVPDWDGLLTEFDAEAYVERIANAGFQSLTQYANSHVGLCLWRTKLGQMHRGMRGRDYFGEVMAECRRRNLHANAYYSMIFDDWAYQTHPDWRILPENGYDTQLFSRTGTVCPNSPYRDHAMACLMELVRNYEFEGIWVDMTFWPAICYCPHCTARYWKEEGAEPPRIVDWTSPAWRTFQKARERWMREFCVQITGTIKRTRPIAVYQQCSTLFMPWDAGVSFEQAAASESCTGDFYGGAAEFSLVCKVFYSLSQNKPFVFLTSRVVDLTGHFEATKSFPQLLLETCVPTAHSAAYQLIDTLEPMGTLDRRTYQFLSQVNAQRDPYEEFLGGTLEADVAVYLDRSSLYDPEVNGVPAGTAGRTWASAGDPRLGLPRVKDKYRAQMPHMDAVVGAARILKEAHIPYGVVTNATLDQLPQYRAVFVPNVFEMTEQQADRFRHFVDAGGILYSSGASSLARVNEPVPRFLLEDVLGVRYDGWLGDIISYLSPANSQTAKVIWPQGALEYHGRAVKAEALPGVQVLATVTLPMAGTEKGYTIGTHFAQIWSNPPAPEAGKHPAVVVNAFGKGKCIWLAAPIETSTVPANMNMVSHLLRSQLPPPYKFEADADRAIEVTLFHQPENKRMLVGLLNMQEPFPTFPMPATVRVQMPGSVEPGKVLLLPEKREMPFTSAGQNVQFYVPPFQVFAMVLVEYG